MYNPALLCGGSAGNLADENDCSDGKYYTSQFVAAALRHPRTEQLRNGSVLKTKQASRRERHEAFKQSRDCSGESSYFSSYETAYSSCFPVSVEMRVVFLKIGEIDTLKEQYHADAFIQARWREPLLDAKTHEELKEVDLSKYWNPLLYIDNILSEQKDTTWVTATVNARGEAYVLERRRVKGIFMENLELEHFPMDVQDLTITITSERSDGEIELLPDNNELSGINIQTFVDQQEWRLHEHIEVSKRAMSQENSSSSRSQPALSVTCRAARRPGYFYWNVFLIMFMISSLSFATFSVDAKLPQNRLQLSFTLFLTSVAFKFVINQSLPKISYLTYMDKYVLMSLFVLCCVCILHSVVTALERFGDSYMYKVEMYVAIAMVIAYYLAHVGFVLILYFGAYKRRRLMKEKDREYKRRIGHGMVKKAPFRLSRLFAPVQ